MTPEARLNRLERLTLLIVRAGARARREMNEKINILIGMQIRTDEKFAKLADSQVSLVEAQALSERKLAKLADSQALTDRKLAKLIDIVGKRQNGDGSGA